MATPASLPAYSLLGSLSMIFTHANFNVHFLLQANAEVNMRCHTTETYLAIYNVLNCKANLE